MSDDTKQISKNRQKKIETVGKLSAELSKAKGLVFTDYQGLTHKQIENLKKAVKPLEANFSVTKNTLLKIALEKQNLKTSKAFFFAESEQIENEKDFEGPTGTLFIYGDIVEPLKKLAKSIKDFNLPKVKFGILDGQALSADQVLKLASLPSREALLAQFVGGLKSPLFGLHRALNWNLQKLVMTLKQIEKSKGVS